MLCMNNPAKIFLFIILVAVTVAGCKSDPPILPAGAAKSNGTIVYTISGLSTTIKDNVAFKVILASEGAPLGTTQILGGTSADDTFSISSATAVAGTTNIDAITIGNLTGVTGKLTITYLSSTDGDTGTLQGTFTADLTDTDGATYPGVTGTFDITQ